jgi:PKD repeat protein
MRFIHAVILGAFLCFSGVGSLMAQVSAGGTPVSFTKTMRTTIQSITMPPVDVAALLAEDSLEQAKGVPYRFGYPFEVAYDLQNSGTWETLSDGGRLWRLRIESPGAYSINLVYDRFWLPPGAKFFIYNEDRSMVIGAFTERNNKEHGKFATAPVKGDVSILEYYEPPGATPGIISIQRVVHAYRNLFNRDVVKETLGFGDAGSCNNNVNCPEGADWQDDKRAVAMILTSGGFRICSGALVNNVRGDLTPYFLTANHCLGGEETWIFMFNYESPSCANIDGPTWMTVSGSTLRATNSYSDFALLELAEAPPDSYNVYFAGWSAVNSPASSAVGIHHPQGDIKKISFDYDPVVSEGVYWRIVQWDDGTTEPGSSGSPLFDSTTHRIIGQLCCGTASCSSPTSDYYGKFSLSWNYGATPSTRLKDWLDPDNTGTLEIDGIDPLGVSFTADTTVGWVPFQVKFTGSSFLQVDTWTWDFGDGDSAYTQSPSHLYDSAGLYDVTLQITAQGDTLVRLRKNYIKALADTMKGYDTTVSPGEAIEVTIYARNTVPVNQIMLPITFNGTLELAYDSFSTNSCRTDYFENQQYIHYNPSNKQVTVKLQASTGGSSPELTPGEGPIIKFYFRVSGSAVPGQEAVIDMSGYSTYSPSFSGSLLDYQPAIVSPVIAYQACCVNGRGNVDGDQNDQVNVSDLTYLIGYLFHAESPPTCWEEANIDGDILEQVNVSDITYLVDYLFRGGPAPPPCP